MTAEDRETEQPSLSMSMFASIEDYLRAMLDAERARADAAERDARRYQFALEDCRLLAARWRYHPGWEHILRFCEAAGVTGSPLRGAATEGVQHGSAA